MTNFATKTELVAARLREEILSGQLPPGSPLLQRELSHRFGISATPLREAFGLLEAEGLVQRRSHRGFIVVLSQWADPWDESVTLEVRSLLERRSIERIIATSNTTVIDLLDEEAEQTRLSLEKKSEIEVRQRIGAFHRGLARGIDSELCEGILHRISSRSQFYPHGRSWEQLVRSQRSHEALVEALRAGNLDRALECWAKHDQDNEETLSAMRAQERADS